MNARPGCSPSFAVIVIQIAIIDIVFSLDSVFTAVGLATPDQVPIMVAAIVISILVMMLVSRAVSAFIDAHPTVKILALAFLVLVGAALIADGCGTPIPKGYLYFAMAFSVVVEMVNSAAAQIARSAAHPLEGPDPAPERVDSRRGRSILACKPARPFNPPNGRTHDTPANPHPDGRCRCGAARRLLEIGWRSGCGSHDQSW